MDETRLVVQLAIGLVFLLSATGKVLHPISFARGVADYQILPESLAFGVGLLLIPLEAFLAVSHLSGWLLAFAAPTGLALLAVFGIAVAVNLKRGRALPCYCFGDQSGETISGRTLARLLLLFAGELLVLSDPALSTAGRLTYPARVNNFAELGLAFFWATFLLIVAIWLLSLTDLLALLRRCRTCGAGAGQPDATSEQEPSSGTS
jgi:hypothetical protein